MGGFFLTPAEGSSLHLHQKKVILPAGQTDGQTDNGFKGVICLISGETAKHKKVAWYLLLKRLSVNIWGSFARVWLGQISCHFYII